MEEICKPCRGEDLDEILEEICEGKGTEERLQRALGRFGVSSLERSPRLESALMWLFRSFARVCMMMTPGTADAALDQLSGYLDRGDSSMRKALQQMGIELPAAGH